MRSWLLIVLLFLASSGAGCRTAARYEPSEAIEVVIAGNEAHSDDELLQVMAEELRTFEEEGFPKSAVDDAAWRLEEFYRSKGYPRVDVTYTLDLESRERPRATFNVEEGPRVAIARVRFPGAAAFDDEELEAFIMRPTRWIRDDTTWYVEARVTSARSGIESLYIEQGYTDVRVGEPQLEHAPDDRSVTITLPVEEGPRRMLHAVELEGVSPEVMSRVQEAVQEHIGEPWFPRRAYFLRAAIREVYAQRGHPEAVVDLRISDPASPQVVPTVVVRPGPRVRIGEVHIIGSERTRERYIRSRLLLEPGQYYDRRKERDSFTRLLTTGLFRQVQIVLEPGEVDDADPDDVSPDDVGPDDVDPDDVDPGDEGPGDEGTGDEGPGDEGPGDEDADVEEVRDVRVVLEELPAREVFVEPGYGSYEMFRLRAGVADKNVLGFGQTLRAEGTVSQRSLRGELGYVWPAFFGTDLVLDGRVFAERRQEPSFLREEIGTEWRLTRRFTRHIKTTLGYEFRQSSALDVDVLEEEDDDVLLSAISLSPSYDSRNSLFWPTGGILARLKTEWSDETIGSELDYTRLLGQLAHYHELSRHFVVAWSYRTGLIFPKGDTEIPIQERFFNGGESTVRSFKESQLGPKDAAGEPLGGEAFNVLSAELRYRFARSWQAAIFVDAGNVVQNVHDWRDFPDVRYGIGAGIRWLLPIGPIRVDFAVNPDPEPDEDDYRIHFSVGSPY